MYCGGELPPAGPVASSAPAEVDAEQARALLEGLTPEARALMPPEVLAKLEAQAAGATDAPPAPPPADLPEDPPVVRSRLGFTGLGRRGTTSRSLKAVKGPVPTPIGSVDGPVPTPLGSVEDDSIEPLPGGSFSDLEAAPPAADLPADPPTLERMRALDPADLPDQPPSRTVVRAAELEALQTASIEPLGTGDFDAYDPVGADSFYDLEPLADDTTVSAGPLSSALSRSGGPFGPHDAAFRLLLLPDEGYRGRAHWLRHRLADTCDIDLYTAVQVLQKEVPSFLLAADDEDEAAEKLAHLEAGGLHVLVLDRKSWLRDVEPLYVTEAFGDPPGPVTFKTRSGDLIEVKRGGFSWAAFGEIQPDTHRRPLLAERSFSGLKVPPGRGFDLAAGPYSVLDIFLSRAAQPIRIRSDRFDFGCLGELRALASTVNMRRMLKWLSPVPDKSVELDERFRRVPHIDGSQRVEDEAHSPVPRRELEFTEYGLILQAARRRR